MLNDFDLTTIAKANKTITDLVADLQQLTASSNPLLAEFGLDIHKQAIEIERKLNRISILTTPA